MRSKMLIALAPLALAGCLSPFTRRLDEANARAAAIQQQLVIATAKLEEANRALEESEKKVDEGNATLRRIEARLESMDKRFAIIEQGLRKMLGIKGPQEEE